MLLANYKEELIFFGIDIWQEIIRIDFTYQKKKKTHKSQKIFESTFFRCARVTLTKWHHNSNGKKIHANYLTDAHTLCY